ncbi:MAG TPA: energy transducer TonB [Methyloradius sp.]
MAIDVTVYSLQTPRQEETLYWALGLSILLHVLMAFILPRMQFEKPRTEQVMTVELVAAQPVSPVPEVMPIPEPAQPTPSKPRLTKLTVKPIIKPMVKPAIQPTSIVSSPPEPQQSTEPSPEHITEPSTAMTQTKEETNPTTSTAVKSSEAERPAIPTPSDTNDARNQYGVLLTRAIARYKQYPAIAQRRGWEGDVILELQLDGNGNLISSRIYQSSNRETLDNQALEMVRKVAPFPLPPQSLRGRSFTILVPVSFKLE